jgi:hypothetical protein
MEGKQSDGKDRVGKWRKGAGKRINTRCGKKRE